MGGDGTTPPEPIVVDGEHEFEIERIKAHRDRRGREREYLVSWSGYDSSEDLWLPRSALDHAWEIVCAYEKRNNVGRRTQPQ